MRSYIGEYRNVCGNFHPAWTGLQRGRAWHSICAHYGKIQFSNRTNDCRFNFRVISSVISRFMTIAQFFGILHSLHYSIWVAVFTFSSEQKPYYYGFISFFGTPMQYNEKVLKLDSFTLFTRSLPVPFVDLNIMSWIPSKGCDISFGLSKPNPMQNVSCGHMINEPQNAFNIDLSTFAGLCAGKWLNANFILPPLAVVCNLYMQCIHTYILSSIYMHGDLSKCQVARYKFNLHVRIFTQFKMNTCPFLHPFEFVQTLTHILTPWHTHTWICLLGWIELEAQWNCCCYRLTIEMHKCNNGL